MENIVTDGETVVIFSDKEKMLRRLNLRSVFIFLPVAVAMFALFGYLRQTLPAEAPPFIASQFAFVPWFIVALYIVLYVVMAVSIRRQRLPIVTISPEGLNIHTVATQIGLLRWEEIAEVRNYNFIYRYVGIVPRDVGGLCRHLGSSAILLRLNSWCIPLYRLIGVFVAPINIPQEYLPTSADDLAERIREYRLRVPV